MNSRLGKKWMVVGVIWGVVLALTGWNIHSINQIQSRRQELETVEMDMHFLKAKQNVIQEVHRQQSRLSHPVKSVGLGFLVVENDLKRLSWDFGLLEMRVTPEKTAQDLQSMPISIFATGPITAIVGWITAVEEAYPYLVIERMDISYDNQNRRGQLKATFNYYFTTAEPMEMG